MQISRKPAIFFPFRVFNSFSWCHNSADMPFSFLLFHFYQLYLNTWSCQALQWTADLSGLVPCLCPMTPGTGSSRPHATLSAWESGCRRWMCGWVDGWMVFSNSAWCPLVKVFNCVIPDMWSPSQFWLWCYYYYYYQIITVNESILIQLLFLKH